MLQPLRHHLIITVTPTPTPEAKALSSDQTEVAQAMTVIGRT